MTEAPSTPGSLGEIFMSTLTAKVAAKIIAVGNQKGGVGKSTTTYHLARAGHLQGLRVLVIDMDPQGNLTDSISRDQLTAETANLSDVLTAESKMTLKDVVVPSLWNKVDLIPTVGVSLSAVEQELSITPLGAESTLKRAIRKFDPDSYDLILIDCPPAIDLLTINALVAADEVLIVTHAERHSMTGMVKLLKNIAQVKGYYNESLETAGIVINAVPKNQTDEEFQVQEIMKGAQGAGLRVFDPVIPRRKSVGSTYLNSEVLDQSTGLRREEHEKNLIISQTYSKYLSEMLNKD